MMRGRTMKTQKILAFVALLFAFSASAHASLGDPFGDPCQTDDDCPVYGMLCCTSAEDCGDLVNTCVRCQTNDDCKYNYKCYDGMCLYPCLDVQECPYYSLNTVCQDGLCMECQQDSDCPGHEVCVMHTCRSCREDSDCPLQEDYAPEDIYCEAYYCKGGAELTDGDSVATTDGDSAIDGDSQQDGDGEEETTDGDQATNDEDGDDDGCSTGGGASALGLLLLLPWLRRRLRN